MEKDVKGHEHYKVTISGKILNGLNPVNPSIKNSNGKRFYVVNLNVGDEYNSVYEVKLVHRLVAEAWLVKPSDSKRKYIIHKDGNTLNNHSTNLAWVTRAEIPHKPYSSKGKPLKELHKDKISKALKGSKNPMNKGKYICEFKSYDTATAAATAFKVTVKTIIKRCNTKELKQKGWYFVPK